MTWNLNPPPGFQGLHPDKPVTMYQRHLPHWRQAGATYFVTFRLADALPQNRLNELKSLRNEWERKNPPPRTDEQWDSLWRETFLRVDRWLDEGAGSCRLGEAHAGKIVAEALRYFDGQRYELGCSVVMPNHVHLAVRPFDEDDEALSRITHSWKRHASREINKLFGLSGALWQDESHDRIIRDEEHLWRTIQYIGRNPTKRD
jgi:REP element-mobilizing transposase RayT